MGDAGHAFIAETLEAPERGELLELVHFSILPPWLVKTINGSAPRSGDEAARAGRCEC